ncbi:sensor histidine kinase [Tepidicella baoligensis]|uniref:sensor histidine kinase n=1 Tax=Tepidicella baoligensis TaxID=2707016 RepID=UPI0015DB59F0|nr:ATP-binding protein [Tepidicella baoligensis]
MSLTPIGDHLPESFFHHLFPERTSGEEHLAPATDAGNARLQRLIEHWPGAVFCLDAQLQCLLANREARRWYAASADASLALPQPLHRLLPPPMMEILQPCLSAALRGMEMAQEESFEHPGLGRRSWMVRALPDHDGAQVLGVFLHLQDTTDWNPVATPAPPPARGLATPDTEAQLRLLAEGLRDAAIFFLDPEGRVSDWPPSAQRLLGYTPAQMLGQDLSRLAPMSDPRDATDPITLGMERAALLGQSETPGWQRRADGSTFWANTLLTALYDTDSGQACGYACLMRDMTEVKRLVDMLQELNAALETRVEERTRQLQDINQDLEAFSYSVSHDLRAPLRHIGSFVELLREDLGTGASATVQRHLDTIAQAAQHMGQLIEGLLAFSKLGRAPIRRRNLAMADLLHSSLNRVQHDPALRRPEPEVHWELPPELPTVAGDALLLSQVWDNLLANALKYTRPRTPALIRIGYRFDPPTNGPAQWVFWVQDNGVGFNPQRADRLFGVFQRLHRASEFEGTGIGLALCRRIVERHGGRIWAESTLQVGSTFYFSLPASTGPH